MADEEATLIEPYFQTQGKFLVDTLFDKGLLSESLSRDGMDRIEDIVALLFQQQVNTAKKCARIIKGYKGRTEDRDRHDEEMRWIARAKAAEARMKEFEAAAGLAKIKVGGDAAKWASDVVGFLRKTVSPPYNIDACMATQLLSTAFELGIAEPDWKPGKVWVSGNEKDPGHWAEPVNVGEWACRCGDQPGDIIPLCGKCGGRKLPDHCPKCGRRTAD